MYTSIPHENQNEKKKIFDKVEKFEYFQSSWNTNNQTDGRSFFTRRGFSRKRDRRFEELLVPEAEISDKGSR